jgi:hypothetical protein
MAFDREDSYRSVEIDDGEIATMWDKVGGLYDESDEAPVSAPAGIFTDNSDNANFLK